MKHTHLNFTFQLCAVKRESIIKCHQHLAFEQQLTTKFIRILNLFLKREDSI